MKDLKVGNWRLYWAWGESFMLLTLSEDAHYDCDFYGLYAQNLSGWKSVMLGWLSHQGIPEPNHPTDTEGVEEKIEGAVMKVNKALQEREA